MLLKKVGITTRPFRYDLNQIPYNYTVEVRNRFKGLDLIECLMNYGPEVRDIVQETGIKTIPKKKKCKQAKWLSEEALQIAQKRGEAKSKGEKERYSLLNAEEVRVSVCKLFYIEWINKFLLYGTENYTQYPMINNNEKEYLNKECK